MLVKLLTGGFVATVVLTTTLRMADELGLTRMDIPFLLGTVITANRARAKAVGYGLHFVSGLVFAFIYGAILIVLDATQWWWGALLGLAHALFFGTAILNVLLPLIHPRMGTSLSAANSTPLLEPPGFMLINYGRGTPIVTILAHMAYGAIIGYSVGR
jgi:hypothetical protein